MRYVSLTSLTQIAIGVSSLCLLCWTVVVSATMVIDIATAKTNKSHSELVQSTYETRLNVLSGERDQRALEAQGAQERFYVALEQISQQQSELLNVEEQRRELEVGLDVMQKKLQASIKERDQAQQDSAIARAELAGGNGNSSTALGAIVDVESTLTILSDALEYTAKQRDAMIEKTIKVEQKLADLAFDSALQDEKQNRIFASLEEAVEVSLTPLENALNRSGIDTDRLLNEIRNTYSGIGGPLKALTVSSRSGEESPSGKRANKLLGNLDRINLLKLGVEQLPLAIPVDGSFRYTSGFGSRRDPKGAGRRMHNGRDMAGSRGTAIVASGDGTVVFAARQRGFGNMVKIRHLQGFESIYAHLNKIRVKVGQKVSRGDRIGDMGNTGRSTGVHLHYEIRIGGKPVNPTLYMKAANNVF